MSDGPLDELEVKLRRREKVVNRVFAVLVVAAMVATAVFIFREELRDIWRGESTLWGARTYTARHARRLGDVEIDRVHRELLPAWVIALGSVDLEGGPEAEAQAWQTLRLAVAADTNLLELAVEMREKALEDPVKHADRLYYLTWAWTRYLEENDIGYVVQSNVASGRHRAFFYVKIYDTLVRLDVILGDHSYPARVVNRVDATNVRESYLGATTKGAMGATVVVDRILDFAIRRVWPALEPDNDTSLDPLSRAWAKAIRAEAKRGLSSKSFELLRETAAARLRLQNAVESNQKRAECGSNFVIQTVPWRGFEPRTIERLHDLADRALDHPCPDVTPTEADVMEEVSDELAGTSGLGDAVREMVMWIARPIAIHEGRHVADDELVNGLEEPLSCDACGDMPGIARAELSAYLASFAWSEAPHVAFFQACDATRSGRGAHAMAVQMILEELGSTCEDGPVSDLGSRSRTLESDWLGRSDKMTLSESRVVEGAKF